MKVGSGIRNSSRDLEKKCLIKSKRIKLDKTIDGTDFKVHPYWEPSYIPTLPFIYEKVAGR